MGDETDDKENVIVIYFDPNNKIDDCKDNDSIKLMLMLFFILNSNRVLILLNPLINKKYS